MTFSINMHINNDKAVIALKGRFQFGSHRDFRKTCDDALKNPAVKTIEVNMSGVEYLDSSALGMLLLLRERANSQKKKVILAHCSTPAKQALDVAKFDIIFTMV